jgi:hypothetical protein
MAEGCQTFAVIGIDMSTALRLGTTRGSDLLPAAEAALVA